MADRPTYEIQGYEFTQRRRTKANIDTVRDIVQENEEKSAKALKVVLDDEGVDAWDWIVQQLAGDPPNPAEMKRIERECTPVEIAKTYAMHTYSQSAELKDSAT